MKTFLTTLLAIAAVVLLWFRLGADPIQPEIPLPDPGSRAADASKPVTFRSEEGAVPSTARSITPAPSPARVKSLPAVGRPLSPSEVLLKAKLDKQVAAEVPTHRMTIDQVRKLTGWLVSENSNQVTFAESYGNAGSMSVNINRKRIVSIEVLTNKPPIVTDRDVRFQSEFPQFNFFKRYPYTIVTDEAFFQVERIVRDLQKTYGQFTSRFKPLIQIDRSSASDVQVLVFSSQEAFRDYARVHFHGTNDIAGFYSLDKDRLVVFNQTSANWIQEVIAKEEAEAILRYGDSANLRRQLAERRGSRESDLKWFAKQFTMETVRHEGAHQMCYTLGVLEPYPRDLTWLAEGLALYSETETIGAINYWRVEELKRHFPNKTYPGINAIMEASYQPDYLSSYSSYWALTRFLMESTRQSAFLQFMRDLKNPAIWERANVPDDLALLCQSLGTDPATLDKEWRRFLEHL